jgi:PAS domain S-box-containing protein
MDFIFSPSRAILQDEKGIQTGYPQIMDFKTLNYQIPQPPTLICDEIMMVVDEKGKIIDANPACVDQFGINFNEIIGSSFDTYFILSREQRILLLNRIAEEKTLKLETLIRGVDRSNLPVHVSVSPMKSYASSRVAKLITNGFKPRELKEAAQREMADQQAQLVKTSGHITESPDVEKILEQIGRAAKGMLDAAGCSIYLVEGTGEILTPSVSLESHYDHEILSNPISMQYVYSSQAVKAKRSLIFNDPKHDRKDFHFSNSPPADNECVLVVPFIVDDDALGAMCINRRGEIFTTEDLDLADTFATFAETAFKYAQSHQKLQREVEKRAQVEKALKNTKHEQAIILDSVEELILHLDTDLRIEWVNRAAVESVPFTKQDIIGKHCYTIWHLRHEPCHDCPVKKAIDTGMQHEIEITTPDGRVWDIKGYPVLDKTGEVSSVVEVTHEITIQRQRDRQQEAIIQLSTALRNACTLKEMMPIILDQIHELVSAHGTALGLRDQAGGDIIIELGTGGAAGQTGAHFPVDKGITGQVIESGDYYVHNDVLNDDFLFVSASSYTPRALAVFPLISQDVPIGALYIGKDFEFSESDIRVLNTISELVANAIQRATFHEETQRRLHRLDALHQIDLAITASMDLNVTLNILLDHVISQLKVDATAILVFNTLTQTLQYNAGRGFRGNAISQTSLRLGEGCPGIAALERKTISYRDLTEVGCFKRKWLLSSENFITYFGVPLIAKGEVKGVLELFHRERFIPDHEWLNFLEMLAGQAAIAIDSATLFENLQRSNLELAAAYNTTLEGWARALELRDRETEGHTRRVTEMTMRLASAMDVRSNDLVQIQRGAMLHDIGKMGIPDNILTKPGSLTNEEWIIMHQHPIFAQNLLISIPYLQLALDIPYCHHEKWDGSGYPRGLRGEEIPLAARIFAIIDVWDALLSDRPYRKAWPEDKVLAYLQDQNGKHFDPKVVNTFFALRTQNQLIELTAA